MYVIGLDEVQKTVPAMEGAKGVQLAELGMQSWRERKWVDVPELS